MQHRQTSRVKAIAIRRTRTAELVLTTTAFFVLLFYVTF